ncbi:hypothetical protein LCGC14_0576400 [marine sediment metagenome]|uniref:Methyltransferase type 11 domain-containing protein n=1 Tax=marine sediment metagenome TaxID=412755 RepID=A0A0F9U3V5_9ZZZZ|nr:MAG: SAM-dependent methyltransferase [Candidatus Lokiarchaeum sp. GC14_75]
MKSKRENKNNIDMSYHPTLAVYNKLAESYDQRNKMMERWISKVRPILSNLRGDILEVGVGTGNNLVYYHPEANVVAFDWSTEMISQAKLKIKRYGLNNVKDVVIGDIQKLSEYFTPKSFDYVISSWVFCSVPDPILGLREVFKVLRPSGKFIQVEHGISKINIINGLLSFLDPLTSKKFGFHLQRNHLKNLESTNLKMIHQRKLDPTGIFRLLISKKPMN